MKNYKLKKLSKFLKPYMKMEKTIIKFGDIKIKKQKFHQYKRPILIHNIDLGKIVVSKKVSFDKNRVEYFISYKDTNKNWTFTQFLPKMSTHRRDFDNTKCMNFLIKDDKTLKKYKEILKKVTNIYRI